MTKFRVIHGDCLEEVSKLGMKFDFIFADPPFNIGHPYRGFEDKIKDYPHWTYRWVQTCWNACDGVMTLHGPDAVVALYLSFERTLCLKRIAWVNWHYRFGQCNRGNWIDARCHCLIYAKKKNYTWNPDSVLVESDRVQYGDKRIHETENGGRRLPGTIWGIPSDGPYWGRVQGGNKERRQDHPNQLPEKYLERLLLAYTNPGDLCLDPFAGSGTTITVSTILKRPCVTIDVSEESCLSVKKRVKKGAVRVKYKGV